MDKKDSLQRDFLHGLVSLFILHRAGQGPVYGGSLSKALRAVGYQISPGSLYPLLHGLERGHLLRCKTHIAHGRLRKYYQLTSSGRACLGAVREQVGGLVREVILAEHDSPDKTV